MTLLASDIMTKEVTTIALDKTVEDLIHLLRVSHFTGVPVVNADGKAVGLVSETDILRALAYTINPPGSSDQISIEDDGRERGATTRLLRPPNILGFEHAMGALIKRQVREVMTPVLHACRPDDSLSKVCDKMGWKGVHRIVVTDTDGKVVGLISALDAVRRFGDYLKEQNAS